MNKFQLLQPLRISRSFTALWGGQLLSGLGDEAFSVILPMVVYSLTGSVLAMSVLMTLRVIPQISSQVTSLVGPSLGGLIMTFTSSIAGFIFDAITFVFRSLASCLLEKQIQN